MLKNAKIVRKTIVLFELMIVWLNLTLYSVRCAAIN